MVYPIFLFPRWLVTSRDHLPFVVPSRPPLLSSPPRAGNMAPLFPPVRSTDLAFPFSSQLASLLCPRNQRPGPLVYPSDLSPFPQHAPFVVSLIARESISCQVYVSPEETLPFFS